MAANDKALWLGSFLGDDDGLVALGGLVCVGALGECTVQYVMLLGNWAMAGRYIV